MEHAGIGKKHAHYVMAAAQGSLSKTAGVMGGFAIGSGSNE